MTKQEFDNHRFGKGDLISNGIHTGRLVSVDFDFGVIHFMDDKKGSQYCYHYSELEVISI